MDVGISSLSVRRLNYSGNVLIEVLKKTRLNTLIIITLEKKERNSKCVYFQISQFYIKWSIVMNRSVVENQRGNTIRDIQHVFVLVIFPLFLLVGFIIKQALYSTRFQIRMIMTFIRIFLTKVTKATLPKKISSYIKCTQFEQNTTFIILGAFKNIFPVNH